MVFMFVFVDNCFVNFRGDSEQFLCLDWELASNVSHLHVLGLIYYVLNLQIEVLIVVQQVFDEIPGRAFYSCFLFEGVGK